MSSPTHPGGATRQVKHDPHPPDDPLTAALLPDIAAAILHQAGPHTRAVARTWRALHPPRLSLAPHSIPYRQLAPALSTLPSALTALDLRPLSTWACLYPTPIAPLLAATLPHLQHLLLPAAPEGLLSAVLQACPHLHTLVASSITPPSTATCWAPLWDPAVSTRLRSLTLPIHTLAPPLPPLPHLTHLHTPTPAGPQVTAAHLLSLAAAAPSLRSLHDLTLHLASPDQLPNCLATFTALQQLSLHCIYTPTSGPGGAEPLQPLSALTALSSLSLAVLTSATWTPLTNTWVTCLARLTHLRYTFLDDGQDPAAPHLRAAVISELPTIAARLPLLQHLDLDVRRSAVGCCPEQWLSFGEPHSFFRCLAAATQLRHLRLAHLPLPAAEAGLLSSLQALTCLQLHECYSRGADASTAATPAPLWWASSLPALRSFGWVGWATRDNPPTRQFNVRALPLPPLASWSSRLHTLAVVLRPEEDPGCARSSELVDLLGALRGQLVRLQLGGLLGYSPVAAAEPRWCGTAGQHCAQLQALQGMEVLQVLDLAYLDGWRDGTGEQGRQLLLSSQQQLLEQMLLQQLRLPRSLRQCYVPIRLSNHYWSSNSVVQQLRAAFPWVVFREHERLDRDVL